MATSIFDVPEMDCPMEEKQIRDKLARLSGISGLEFNLVARKLSVHHEEGSLDAIISILVFLDMVAELERLERSSRKDPIPWKRLAVSGVLALLYELLDVWGEWSSTGLQMVDHSRFVLLSGASFFMAIAAIVMALRETYKKAGLP